VLRLVARINRGGNDMINRNVLRGIFVIAIALIFGIGSFNYSMGSFARAGPGLFPLMVSSVVFVLGVAMVIRSFFVERLPLEFNIRNIAVILGSLVGFALLSELVNMIVGIIFMVFCATLAGTSYSVVRNLKIAAGLIAVAFLFLKGLGVQLPLY